MFLQIQLVCINAAGTCRIFSVYKYVSPRKGVSEIYNKKVSVKCLFSLSYVRTVPVVTVVLV